MRTISRQDGFTITEMLVSSTIMLLIVGGALTTFRNAVQLNDAASQLGDSTQNLRAGTNLLVRDLMMAGRIFGSEGVPLPSGTGVVAYYRPGPIAGTFTTVGVDVDDSNNTTTLNLPSITTGYKLGPKILGSFTDMVTIMTVDEFMPVVNTPPQGNALTDATIAPDGSSITLAATATWLAGDTVNDTRPIIAGDLILFKNPNGSALQYVTRTDATHIYFDNSSADPFHFNQRGAPSVPLFSLKGTTSTTTAWGATLTTLFRALMITYYVDCPPLTGPTATPPIVCPATTTPRLTRQINNWAPTALAGVVEDLDLTYDLVDGINNPTAVTALPWTDTTQNPSVTYNSNQIRKVNVHVGVRSEQISKPTQDYVRNHINTSVDVRSLASVDRYQTAGEIQ